ncbi:uncharacterized protein LOC106417843 [Brassica napus]|uniref:uncharacterized protein LOC106417843 n=1 Tax=Brassica napus TaxID=3708 RepID=UPI002079A801|nr:uncharacterized protein LOC106417843 [Brassica napus]
MEKCLRSNNIPKEKKLSQAVQAFTGNAYKWWLKESSPSIYNQPVVDWRDLKVRMYKEFAEKYQDKVDATSKFHCQATRKVMFTPKPHTVPKPKKAHDHEPKEISSSVLTHQAGFKRSAQLNKVQPQPITTPLPELQKLQEMCQRLKETLEPKEENTSNQGKSSDLMKPKNPTCYRCHKRGHFAAVCPFKKTLKETSLGEQTEISKISDSLIQSNLLVSNACIMLLSMSKGFYTGTKGHDESIKEEPTKGSDILVPLELSNSVIMHLLPKDFDPGMRQVDGRPDNDEKFKENQGQHLTCPQNVEEVQETGRVHKLSKSKSYFNLLKQFG